MDKKPYQASYIVNGGESGFGCFRPVDTDASRTFEAENDGLAYWLACWYAHYLSMNHLLDPTNGKTSVKILSLIRPDSTEIDQQQEASRLEHVVLKGLIHRDPSDGKTLVHSTFNDHLYYPLLEPFYKSLGFEKVV